MTEPESRAGDPRVQLFRCLDDETRHAAVYLDGKGRVLPMFHIMPATTAAEAYEAAVDWWRAEREKQARKKAPPPRKAAAPAVADADASIFD